MSGSNLVRVIAAALLLFSWQASGDRGTTLTVTAVDADTGRVLQSASIILEKDGGVLATRQADLQGVATFVGVPAGLYGIEIMKPGYLLSAYGQFEPQGSRRVLEIPIGRDAMSVRIQVWKLGAVTGRLIDDHGDGAIGLPVRLIRASAVGGHSHYTSRDSKQSLEARSDDQGVYRFSGVAPGDYLVVVPGSSLQSSNPTDDRPTVFYPSVHAPDSAVSVHVGPSDQKAGLDITVPQTPAFRLSGRIVGGPDKQTVTLSSANPDFEDLELGQTIADSSGRFAFHGIPEGRYRLSAIAYPSSAQVPLIQIRSDGGMNGGGPRGVARNPETPPTYWGDAQATIERSSKDDVVIAMKPTARILGRLVFVGTAAPPDLSMATIAPVLADRLGAAVPVVGARSDRTFSTIGVPPGLYQLFVRLPGGVWKLRSIMRDGRDVSCNGIDVQNTDVGGFTLTYSDNAPTVTGMVQDDKGQPSSDASVFLFPTERSCWSDFGPRPVKMLDTRTSLSGSFAFPEVLPGEYFVAAVSPPVSQSIWQDSGYLNKLSIAASRLQIPTSGRVSQTLRVVSAR